MGGGGGARLSFADDSESRRGRPLPSERRKLQSVGGGQWSRAQFRSAHHTSQAAPPRARGLFEARDHCPPPTPCDRSERSDPDPPHRRIFQGQLLLSPNPTSSRSDSACDLVLSLELRHLTEIDTNRQQAKPILKGRNSSCAGSGCRTRLDA